MIHETAKTPDDKLRVRIDEMRDASKNQLRSMRSRWLDSARDYRPQMSTQNHRDGVGHNKLQKKRAGNELVQNGSGNRISSIIDQQISMIYENNPRAFFLPKETDDLTFAKDLESLTKWRMDRIQLRQKLIKGGLYSKLFGFQAFHVYWDDSLPDDADVNARILWPESLIIDPKLESQNPEEGDYVGYDRMVNMEYAKRRWPRKASKIKDEMRIVNEGSAIGSDGHNSNQLAAELGHDTQGTLEQPMTDKEKQVEMTVIWFKDYAQDSYKVKKPLQMLIEEGKVVRNELQRYVWAETGQEWTEESSPEETVKVPKYPYGRHVIKVGNTILEDFAWGYDANTDQVRRRSWPIAIAVNKLIPGAWFGQDECEGLRADQNTADVCLQNITEHAYSAAHPVREVDTTKTSKNKGDIQKQLSNGLIPTKGKNAVTTHSAGNINTDVFSLLKISQTNMEISAGISGQSIGREGSSQQTATEIAALQRASRGKVGITSSFVDELVNRLYVLAAEAIQFNYDEGRIVRVLGENNDSKMTAIQITRQLKDVKFDVEVEAGSTLPNDKQQNKVDAQELYGIVGLPSLPNLLDAYEVKNKEEMLQKHQEFQLFQQFGPLLQDPNVQAMLQQYAQQLEAQQGQQPQQAAQ